MQMYNAQSATYFVVLSHVCLLSGRFRMKHFCLNQSLSKFTTNAYQLQLVSSRLPLKSSYAQVWTSALPHTTHTQTIVCHLLAFTIQALFASMRVVYGFYTISKHIFKYLYYIYQDGKINYSLKLIFLSDSFLYLQIMRGICLAVIGKKESPL